MILAYALGGGLGHLTRVRAALHTLGRHGPVAVVSASGAVHDRRVTGDAEGVLLPAGLAFDIPALRRRLADLLHAFRPDEVVVDCFPAGIRGELDTGLFRAVPRLTHLARLLRWDRYAPLVPPSPPRYDEVFAVEPLTTRHAAVFPAAVPLALADPPDPRDHGDVHDPDTARNRWIVVHSGPAEETAELVAYSSARGGRDVRVLDTYPAWPLFAAAERIVTAAGFNAIRQAAEWRDKHLFVPFPRRFDDQFLRAARTQASSSPSSLAM